MEKLAAKNRTRFLDLLNERLTFERSGVLLYDTVLERLRDAPHLAELRGVLAHNRAEEKEHEEWLEAQIRALGGDDRALSDQVILVKTEAEGIERVIRRDPSIPHDLHALLSAELSDNAGWELLYQLADEVGDRDAKKEFKKRLKEEAEHLLKVREALLELTKEDVLQAPTAPAQ